jgi:hypothetical protein
MSHPQGVIVGAYPSAPSFHQKGEAQEIEFFKTLAANEKIRGLEQPFHQTLHPYGTEFLLKNTPAEWQIAVTAISETMRIRKDNPAFGLASTDEEGRQACLAYYRSMFEAISDINAQYSHQKVIALQIHGAPDKRNASVEEATAAFYQSMTTITSWDWSCPLIIEHCDSMTGISPRKAFLPLAQEIDVAKEFDMTICLNWARSVLETKTADNALHHAKVASNAGVLGAVMFSGTAPSGPYGEWDDLHAPFAPFDGCQIQCPESLMTQAHAADIFAAIQPEKLLYLGTKLLEADPSASIEHRASIINDGVLAIQKSL